MVVREGPQEQVTLPTIMSVIIALFRLVVLKVILAHSVISYLSRLLAVLTVLGASRSSPLLSKKWSLITKKWVKQLRV